MPAIAEQPVMSPARAALKGKTFRCFAYKGKSGAFYAECIDLGIMVKAKTMKKAVSSLGDAIEGYLEVAANGEDRERLLHRSSPISHRLHYHTVGVKLKAAKALHIFDGMPHTMKLFNCPKPCHA